MLKRASKRLSSSISNSFDIVYKYLDETSKLLTHLSIQQAIENKKFIKEAKEINKYDTLTPEMSNRMKDILQDRTHSSREKFRKYVANSRNSPSKAMTMMQKHKSIHKTVASEDTLNAIEYWSDLYKNKDRNEK